MTLLCPATTCDSGTEAGNCHYFLPFESIVTVLNLVCCDCAVIESLLFTRVSH